MKDSIKHRQSSGILSDLMALCSVMNSRKTKVFLYGFMVSFVACTTYLAFLNPSGGTGSGTGVPWFNNIFASAASSTATYRSQISNFFSHFLPNSSSFPSPEAGIGSGRSGVVGGGNGVTKGVIGFQPSGVAGNNKSVEELGFGPTKDQGMERKKDSVLGLQGSGVSGKNKTETKSFVSGFAGNNGTGNDNSTKNDGNLNVKEKSGSRNGTSTATPPVRTGSPAEKDSSTEKQSDKGNQVASATTATQEVKDGGEPKNKASATPAIRPENQKNNETATNNQTSNGSQGNSPSPKNPASKVPVTPAGGGNRTGFAPPLANRITATKSQGSSGNHSNNAPVPSQSKSASPATKNQNQTKSTPNASSLPAAITSKASAKPNSSKNSTVSPIKGNGGLKESPKTAPNAGSIKKDDLIKSMIGCDMFQGNWVRDDSYPLYPEGSCPHIDEPFDCYLNGRTDRNYQKLRWQPHGCKIPRFNAIDMLERLRGKRIVFVGDSLNRNMWESLVCALRHAIKDKSKVFEASGRHEFRTEGSYSFLYTDYNCSVEFFRSPFLVQEWEMPVSNSSRKETLRLDLIERSSPKYKDADVLIFNTGHWWTHEKTAKGKDYYQEGNHVYSELNVVDAFHKALNTWAKWIDTNVNSKKTIVLFRGYSASHFSGGQWNSGGACDKETEPIKNEKYLSMYPPKMSILEDVITSMKTPVVYMNITRMTDYRKDAHPSIYRKQNLTEEERRSPERYQDCSHWCLPGVPDSWNELLYAQILVKQYQMSGK